MAENYLLYRGRNAVDAGVLYGTFTSRRLAEAYRLRLIEKRNVPGHELNVAPVLVDPEFHESQPEVVDNRKAPG